MALKEFNNLSRNYEDYLPTGPEHATTLNQLSLSCVCQSPSVGGERHVWCAPVILNTQLCVSNTNWSTCPPNVARRGWWPCPQANEQEPTHQCNKQEAIVTADWRIQTETNGCRTVPCYYSDCATGTCMGRALAEVSNWCTVSFLKATTDPLLLNIQLSMNLIVGMQDIRQALSQGLNVKWIEVKTSGLWALAIWKHSVPQWHVLQCVCKYDGLTNKAATVYYGAITPMYM